MKKVLTLTIGLIAALIITACTSVVVAENQRGEITGTVNYRERVILPENAKITVSLQDVSIMDVKAELISQHAFIAQGQQVPLSFSLTFDNDVIEEGRRYALSARIEHDGKLLFITDRHYGVLTDTERTTSVDLMLIKVN
ncbi:YbaY family lipoprotein [Thaumasiovibrio sp. DFM-14]|uniref:YbaY family lipoprotein n=1 Tax=Thaumasiovibrio sp. DFM-14 TaxID=3384792 RepID=UPI00399F7FF2